MSRRSPWRLGCRFIVMAAFFCGGGGDRGGLVYSIQGQVPSASHASRCCAKRLSGRSSRGVVGSSDVVDVALVLSSSSDGGASELRPDVLTRRNTPVNDDPSENASSRGKPGSLLGEHAARNAANVPGDAAAESEFACRWRDSGIGVGVAME